MQQRFFLTKIQKKNILLLFTKELIRNSGEDFYTLGKIVNEKEENKIFGKKQIPLKVNLPRVNLGIGAAGVTEKLKSQSYEKSLQPLTPPKEKFRKPLGEAKLVVPETKLPTHLEYLKPSPSKETIDLGKLNSLIKDPMIRIIECPGPDQNITVTGTMGTKGTGMTLSRDEISGVIDRFSIASKIPVAEGVFKVVLGNLIFMAIVSEIVGSRFTIRKMIAEMPMRR